jgi:hypothetical protein
MTLIDPEKDIFATLIDGGWRVKTNDAGTHYVDILRMAYNYRIVLTPIDSPLVYDRFWCYVGTSPNDFLRVAAAAAVWDGALDTEPLGWNKNGTNQNEKTR